MARSLKKQIDKLCSENLPKVFESPFRQKLNRLKKQFNSVYGAFFVFPLVISFYWIGQHFKPVAFQIFRLDPATAFTLIDQRLSNMATIFSITLVVIGWLITNLAVKESISYKLMFKRIYLYPIFYFVATVIASLVVISLFRNTDYIDAGDAIVSAAYLIIIAIIAITFLFTRLILVVDDSYFFSSLEEEVLAEAYTSNYEFTYIVLGRKLYSEKISSIGITFGGTSFFAQEQHHRPIPISTIENHENIGDGLDILLNEPEIIIVDVNTDKIYKLLTSPTLVNENYFQSVGVFEKLNSSFFVFEIHRENTLSPKKILQIQSSFKIKLANSKRRNESGKYTEYLKSRLIQESSTGKKKNVDTMLQTMRLVYEMDDSVKSILQ